MKPIVETVERIYSTGTNVYDNVLFEHYIVYLEGHEGPYKMTKKYVEDVDYIPKPGDLVTCIIEGGRMKHVKLLLDLID